MTDPPSGTGGAPVPLGTPPPEFRRRLRLRDGRTVTVAPLTPADATELGEALRRADPETLYRRFCGPPPRVTANLLRYLTELDYVRRFALVARAPDGQGIAIARYETLDDTDVADVAVAVAPEWRRAGLATALVRLLAEAALARGITRFSATYLAENRQVAGLLNEAGARQTIADGIAEAVVPLRGRSEDFRP